MMAYAYLIASALLSRALWALSPKHEVRSTMDTKRTKQHEMTLWLISFYSPWWIAFIIIFAIFLWLFPRMDTIYYPRITIIAPRERIVKSRPTSFLGWCRPLFSDQQEILQKCGFDSYLAIRHHNMLMIVIAVFNLVALPTLLPVNWQGEEWKKIPGNQQPCRSDRPIHDLERECSQPWVLLFPGGMLDRSTVLNIGHDDEKLLWAHLAIVVFMALFICAMIWNEQKNFVLQWTALCKTPGYRIKPSSSTVLVRGIPDKERSERALRAIFCTSRLEIQTVSLMRDCSHVTKEEHRRNGVMNMFEWVETNIIKDAESEYRKAATSRTSDYWDARASWLAFTDGYWTRDPDYTAQTHDEEGEAQSDTGSVIVRSKSEHKLSTIAEGLSSPSTPTRSHMRLPANMLIQTRANPIDIGYRATNGQSDNDGDTFPEPQELGQQFNDPLFYMDQVATLRVALVEASGAFREAQNTITPALDSAFITFSTQRAAMQACRMRFSGRLKNFHVKMALSPLDFRWGHLCISTDTYSRIPGLRQFRLFIPFIYLPAIYSLWKILTREVFPPYVAKFMIFFLMRDWGKWTAGFWEIQVLKEDYISTTEAHLIWFDLQFAWICSISLFYATLPNGFKTVADEFMRGGLFKTPLLLARHVPAAENFYLGYMLFPSFFGACEEFFKVRMWWLYLRSPPCTPRDVWHTRRDITSPIWPPILVGFQAVASIGIALGAICPLILPVILLSMTLAWILLRYNIVYVDRQRYDTGGAYFRRSLDHLFITLYIVLVLLIGLWFPIEASDNSSHENISDSSYDAYKRCGILYTTIIIIIMVHFYTRRNLAHKTQDPYNYPDNETNPNNEIWDEKAASPAKEIKDPLQACLYGTMTLHDLGPAERRALIETAYLDPHSKPARRVIWIPRDNCGLSDDEILMAQRWNVPEKREDGTTWTRPILLASNDGAAVGADGRVFIAKPPPDFELMHEIDL